MLISKSCCEDRRKAADEQPLQEVFGVGSAAVADCSN